MLSTAEITPSIVPVSYAPLDREGLLAIFLDTAPTARSPYGLYDYPPMWPVQSGARRPSSRASGGP